MDFESFFDDEDFVKLVIKGEPGTRKTTHAATFPGPIRLLDIDKKAQSLRLPRSVGFGDAKIDVEQFTNWYGVESELKRLEVNCPYKTVIIDSLTSLGDLINRQTLNKGTGGKKIGGIAVNTIEDFNAETSALMYMVDMGKTIKAHFILIAHVIMRDYRSPTGNSHILRQLVTGSKVTGAKIPAYFPEIYHFAFDQQMDVSLPPRYVMYTQPSGEDFARTALPLNFKEDITERRLWDIVNEGRLKLAKPKELTSSTEETKTAGW